MNMQCILQKTESAAVLLMKLELNLLFDDVERYLVGRDVYFDTAYVLDKMSISQFEQDRQVTGSSSKGSREGAMVKEGCFSPKKTRKALENQGLLC